ncbi:MAG: alpha/beta hydrolase [Bryobacterales bacterium]|nr:alpha/beta hydrolase [Bryobacterales bacterium]
MHVERIDSRRSSPVLVFLHHGLGSIAQWRTFPAMLCAQVELPALLIDREGHGLSDPAPPRPLRYLESEAERFAQYLAEQQLDEVILVGHSDGASIALLHAASNRAPRPIGVVSMAAHLFVEDVTRAGVRIAAANHSSLRARLRRYHGSKADALFWHWAGAWLAPSFDDWDISARMRDVQCPVLALQGADDEYGTLAQVSAIQENCTGPVTRVILPDCAHEPHLQAPAETLRVIAQWILALPK